ncbi:MAG: L-aspartate oxidase [Bacteroidales bacterium]|nr:L-aspartate oxidase [Bacteroidales bacterium]
MQKQYDFLVIGSGLAGLSFALKVADKGSVAILTKAELQDTNTSYAQGGIAAVTYKPDNYEKHVEDTLIAGDGLCNEEVVRMVVNEAPERIQELIKWGTNFDREKSGKFDLAREGGHSEHRILHHKDDTGREIQRALIDRVRQHPNIDIFQHFFALDIITQHHLGVLVKWRSTNIECYGVYALDIKNKEIVTFLSRVTLMATGGTGNLYSTTTNPGIATGDGIAMVYRAKGTVENMEFVQFHPTSLYNPNERPSFLITEAMRGHGGILKTIDGKEFMHKYDKRASLAPRDIVARAIDHEMKLRGDDYVYLDCRHLDAGELTNHFPNIYEKCKTLGIDITRNYIPVVPAAHYLCGGVKVDKDGRTVVNRLYAAGETASTGLHGANRLASNSLLEAIVFSHNASVHALEHFRDYSFRIDIPEWSTHGVRHPEEMVLITQSYKEVQQIFSVYVGIVRSNVRLKRSLDRLETIYHETERLYQKSILTVQLCELRNLINVGYLIIKGAMRREENRGLHYNIDYPLEGKMKMEF